MKKFYKITDDIYGKKFLLCICGAGEMRKKIKKDLPLFDKLDEIATHGAQCLTITDPDSRVWRYIWIEKFNWTVEDQVLLSHEILHYVMQIMREVGIQYYWQDENINEEAFTYYFQYILFKVWTALKP